MTAGARDDRTNFIWFGRDDDLNRLTAALVPKILGELVNVAGTLCRPRNGVAAPVDKDDLAGIVNRYLRRPVALYATPATGQSWS
jgi:hypothetical protein